MAIKVRSIFLRRYACEVVIDTDHDTIFGFSLAANQGRDFHSRVNRTSQRIVEFCNPAAFRRRFEVDGVFRQRLAVAIVDNYFEGITETGVDFARELRKRSQASLLFGSDAELSANELEVFDAVCGKKARPWAELRAIIAPADTQLST